MNERIRNPMMVWGLTVVTCGFYGLYWWYLVGNELKQQLGKEDLNPVMDIVIMFICSFYGLYMPIKYGKLIQEAQQRAGHPQAEDQGVMFLLLMLLCGYGYAKMQEELNKIWESGGGGGGMQQPAQF